MNTLSGRTCVFAGATGKIGKGAVRALAEGGMNVVMVTHNPDSAKSIIEEMKSYPGRVIAVSNDNGDGAACKDAFDMFGSVDVVINSTGGMAAPLPIESIDVDALKGQLNFKIGDTFAMIKQALPFLKKSRAPRIILVSTIGALDGFEQENLADSLARGALSTMTFALARMLSKDSITVNLIARSGMINDHDPGKGDLDTRGSESLIPLGRLGTDKDFGALVEYIAGEEAGFVTGHIFNLSGGIKIG